MDIRHVSSGGGLTIAGDLIGPSLRKQQLGYINLALLHSVSMRKDLNLLGEGLREDLLFVFTIFASSPAAISRFRSACDENGALLDVITAWHSPEECHDTPYKWSV